jgi:dihydroorotase
MANGWEYTTFPPVLAPTAVCPGGAITRSDIEVCDTAGVLAANWQFYAGIKVRLSYFLIGNNGVQILQMALDAATKAEAYSGHHFPVMVHVGALESTSMIDTIVTMLRAGDIITHSYSEWAHGVPAPTGFAQNSSCSNHSAAAAAAKGIIIDLGFSSGPAYGNNAFGPLSYVICGKIGITADSLSADDFAASSALYSMTDIASILLGLNNGNNITPTAPAAFLGPISPALTLDDLVTKMTRGPALVLGDRVPALLGTLQVGAPGDAAVLNVASGSFAYSFGYWGVTSPTQITVVKTIKGGVVQ